MFQKKPRINKRFRLQKSDGVHGAQVLVYNDDDYRYWYNEARNKGYMMKLNFYAPDNAFGYPDPAHYIYSILPVATHGA
jgi:hypothetical protein